MIFDGVLTVFGAILQVLLAPLEVINIGIDFVSSIPLFASFIQVIAYLFPWSNILPIILLTMLILNFRLVIATIRAIYGILPSILGHG